MLWLLRGAELAALLGEQAEVDLVKRRASLSLSATKTDPGAAGRLRAHACSCTSSGGEVQQDEGALCPVHLLAAVLADRQARGLSPKHALFASDCGSAPSRKAMCSTIKLVTLDDGASEHSLRRSGAQFYARDGADVAAVQHLGRWGGPTSLRYIEEVDELNGTENALRQARRAIVSERQGRAGGSTDGLGGSGSPCDRGGLALGV